MLTTTVIVETPGRTAAKYVYDAENDGFVLVRVLPVGMILPYDFGFVPGTLAEDGDPLDAMVLSELQTYPGCRLECRVIGAITATQREKLALAPHRSDFLLVVPTASIVWANVRELDQVPRELVDQLEYFSAGYHRMVGESFVPIERLARDNAIRLVQASRAAAAE
jgi:inorganic pyrophosphatase